MIGRIVRFIFFGNYFVGILAIALCMETCFQLHIPLNSLTFYALLSCATIMYYTYAYTGVLQSSSATNLRSQWYQEHSTFVQYTQIIFFAFCAFISATIFIKDFPYILDLPWQYWLIVVMILLACILYYGLLPRSLLKLNLRNTGWLKAFAIGFVWAGCVSLIPIVALTIDNTPFAVDPILLTVLFIKNWMFCTVNAMMFDFKDYADDSNKQLQTFVVRFGLNRTITYIIIPLVLVGIATLVVFTRYRHLEPLPIFILLIPFLLLLIVSYSMYRQKSIFYYLIVIDGIVLVKALTGILAAHLIYK